MNNFDAAELLRAFPIDVPESSRMACLAACVAEELQRLSDDHDLTAIYTQIDALDERMLDILAIDFKIDWWDANAELEKKRKVFKSCFAVKRRLGTKAAVQQALSDMYSSARVTEWFDYGGQPYHYRMTVDLGEQFGSAEIARSILSRTRFYANVRSVLDSMDFLSRRTQKLFCGCALLLGLTAEYNVDYDETLLNCLADEDGILLMDETGDLLLEKRR